MSGETALVAGPFFAAAVLLGWAGTAKLVTPEPAERILAAAGFPARPGFGRLVGLGELALAVVIVATGARLGAGLLVLAGVTLAVVADRARRRAPGSDCGCFGASSAPVGAEHVAVDLGVVVVGLVAIASPPGPLTAVLAGQPSGAVPFVVLVLLTTATAQACLTALPAARQAARRERIA